MNYLTIALAVSLLSAHAELFSHEGVVNNRHLVLGRFAFDDIGTHADVDGHMFVSGTIAVTCYENQDDLEVYVFDDETGSYPEFLRTGTSHGNVEMCKYRKSLARMGGELSAASGNKYTGEIHEYIRPRWWSAVVFRKDCGSLGNVKASAEYYRSPENSVDKVQLSYNERYMDALYGLFWCLWTALLVGQITSMSCRAKTGGCESTWRNGFAPIMLAVVTLSWLSITCELAAYAGIADGGERDTTSIRVGYIFFLLGRTAFITLVVYLIRGAQKGVGGSMLVIIAMDFLMQCVLWGNHVSDYTDNSPDPTFFYHTGTGWLCVTLDCMFFLVLLAEAKISFSANEAPHTRGGRNLIAASFIPWFLLTPFLAVCMLGAPSYNIDIAFQAIYLVLTYVTQLLAVVCLGFQGERCFSNWNSKKYLVHVGDESKGGMELDIRRPSAEHPASAGTRLSEVGVV